MAHSVLTGKPHREEETCKRPAASQRHGWVWCQELLYGSSKVFKTYYTVSAMTDSHMQVDIRGRGRSLEWDR